MSMEIKDMPIVTTEQVLALRQAAFESETDNAILREELAKEREALSSAQKVMDVYEKQKRTLREELAALKQSLVITRASAIMEVLDQGLAFGLTELHGQSGQVISVSDIEEYINKVEVGL